MTAAPFVRLSPVLGLLLALAVIVKNSDAEPPSGRYVLGAGTVRDTKTGLVWQLQTNTRSDGQAVLANDCAILTLNDSSWRLPTIKELQTLIDPSGVPYMDQTAFGRVTFGEYWTSSPVAGAADEFWTFTWYGDGYPELRARDSGLPARARCVRVGPRPPVDACVDAPLPPTASFSDDFEDGVFDDWTLGTSSATHTVTSETAAAGSSYSLRIQGADEWFNGPNNMFADFVPRHARFWVRFGSVGRPGTGTFALSADRGAVQHIVVFYGMSDAFVFDGDGQLSTRGSMSPELDRWYFIEIDLDWTAKTFAARIDGTPLGETGFKTSSATEVVRLDLFNADDAISYLDEIEVVP